MLLAKVTVSTKLALPPSTEVLTVIVSLAAKAVPPSIISPLAIASQAMVTCVGAWSSSFGSRRNTSMFFLQNRPVAIVTSCLGWL